MTDDSPDVHPLPQASPWVPRALFGFAVVSLLLMAASWWNPWRLLVLDDHDLALTVVSYFGCCALVVALWLTLPRGPLRRPVLSLLTVALGLGGLLAMLVAPFAPGVGDTSDRVGDVNGGSIHIIHSTGIMSGCYRFEVRDESGRFTRHRLVNRCLDDESEQPSASIDGSQLTVTVGKQVCVYDVDATEMQVHPIDPSCDILGLLRPTP